MIVVGAHRVRVAGGFRRLVTIRDTADGPSRQVWFDELPREVRRDWQHGARPTTEQVLAKGETVRANIAARAKEQA